MGGVVERSREGKAAMMVTRQFCPQMALARFPFPTALISAGRPLTLQASPSAALTHKTQLRNMKTSMTCYGYRAALLAFTKKKKNYLN